MKTNPAEQAIRERMQPGILSGEGFLGDDQRSLGQIVAEDAAILEAAGITARQIANLLTELHELADAGLESPVRVADGEVVVQECEVMGQIPCPFGCGKSAHKAALTVEFDGRRLQFTPLVAHLIGEHGFFQGRGSCFRLEPADAIALYRSCRPAG